MYWNWESTATSNYISDYCFTNHYQFAAEKPELMRWEVGIPKVLLKSWRIWTGWKRELPMAWEIGLPDFVLVPRLIRRRGRERRHVVGHSPRR